MQYFEELKRSMNWLSEQPDTIFLGQAVACPGTAMTNTLKDVSPDKLKEMPVAENMQLGISTSLSLTGFIPISIFPRWNFLLLAADQIVNHLDKLSQMSNGGYVPKVIIRTGIGSKVPLDPQEQHKSDFSEAFASMCGNIEVIRLEEPLDIFPCYQKAYQRTDGKSTILVEVSDYYNLK